MDYLSKMTDDQTLVIYSGHPLGLFPSTEDSPMAVVTNGMVIPNYSTQNDYERMSALGVSQFGQMTAGSYMYIGPQGIVHGTAITILNAARKYLGRTSEEGLSGILYVTWFRWNVGRPTQSSCVIAGAVCIVAEIDPEPAFKRHSQGWLNELYEDQRN